MGKPSLTYDKFIEKCHTTHLNIFDYSKTNYVNMLTKSCFICPIHGEFLTTPNNHLISKTGGCKQCVNIQNGNRHRKNKNHFIDKANEIHGTYYDYSLVVYTHSLDYVNIICPIHGIFSMKASNHINNRQGCSKCGTLKASDKVKIDTIEFKYRLSKKKNFEKYDFGSVNNFQNLHSHIYPTCNLHGKYKTTPSKALKGNSFGCSECIHENMADDLNIFLEKSRSLHGDKYRYDNTTYTKAHDYVTITCPTHGDFDIKAYIHTSGGGHCPKCTSFVSSYELEIIEYLKSIGVEDIEGSVRRLGGIKEIDILSEKHKIGVEFNGLYWHSDIFKSNNYHSTKSNKMSQLGYKLIQIFEDEWIFNREICESILSNKFQKTKNKIFARKCSIVEVNHKTAKEFLEKNHIQGFCVSKYRTGLLYNGELVSLMTFGKKRKNLGNSKSADDEYELLRYCNKIHHTIVGGASKLFKNFIKTQKPKSIISFCNMRYGTGGLYAKLGFNEKHLTSPNYFYVKGLKRHNRFSFRKDVLVSSGFPPDKTEKEIMKDLGYFRIYDCGNIKYEWINPNKENII